MPVGKEQGSLTSCVQGGRWSWQGAFIYFVDIEDFLFLQHLASHSCHSFLPSPLWFCQRSLQRNQKKVLNSQCLLPSGVSRPCHPGQVGARGIPCPGTQKGEGLEKGWAGTGPSAVAFGLSRAGLLVCE